MPGSVMILNPLRKRRKSRRRRKMTAKQRRYFGPRRHKSKAPKETVVVATSNPRRRKSGGRTLARRHKRRLAQHHRRYSKNPVRRRFRRNPIRRYQRNPLPSSAGGFLSNSLIPAAIGAVGAIGVDLIIGNAPLPYSLKSGYALPVIRIASALALGALFSSFVDSDVGEEVAAGGMIVTVYQLAKGYLQQNTSLQLAAYRPMGRYLGRGYRSLGFIKGVRRLRGVGARRRMRLHGIGARRRRLGAVGMKALIPRMRGNSPFGLNFKLGRAGGRRLNTGIGYVGPARTLSRYLGSSRNARR